MSESLQDTIHFTWIWERKQMGGKLFHFVSFSLNFPHIFIHFQSNFVWLLNLSRTDKWMKYSKSFRGHHESDRWIRWNNYVNVRVKIWVKSESHYRWIFIPLILIWFMIYLCSLFSTNRMINSWLLLRACKPATLCDENWIFKILCHWNRY